MFEINEKRYQVFAISFEKNVLNMMFQFLYFYFDMGKLYFMASTNY